LTDGAAGVRSEILIGSGVRGRGIDDDGVFQSTSVFECFDHASDVRLLLADGYIDTVEWLVPFELTFGSGFILLSLRNDGVDGDGGLTRSAVTDDELTLTTSDRDHGVDG
jgi:hypothetical protein